MAKKKDKPQIINNIQEMNLEIDYDKLAEAIVKANKKEKNKEDKITHRGLIVTFGNGAIYIGLMFLVFNRIVRICIDSFQNGTVNLFGCIVVFLTSIPVLIFLFLTFRETLCDTEEEALSHFNTNISVVALIVALIALLRGV